MLSDRLDLIWTAPDDQSTEHFTLRRGGDRTTLKGTVVLVTDRQPASVTYRVDVDDAWRTSAAEATISAGDERQVTFEVADGRWTIDGRARPQLDGCIDVDLGWTPATNLLPIRRLALEVGEIARIDAAWLRWPELDVVRAEQTYERVAEQEYVYRSGSIVVTLRTTVDGIVTRYGDDRWLATSLVRPSPPRPGPSRPSTLEGWDRSSS